MTPRLIEWFRRYRTDHPTWGVFHVWLDDGNYKIPVVVSDAEIDHAHPGASARYRAEVREMAATFARLSPSQRKKLAERCRGL